MELDKFKQLYCLYDFEYKGIKMNRVVCIELWHFANHHLKFELKKQLRFLFSYKDVSSMKLGTDILTTSGAYGRIDHMELYKQVIERIGNKTCYNDPDSWDNKRCLNIFKISSLVYKSFKLLKKSDLRLKEKIDLTSEVVYYCNTLDALKKIDFSSVKRYVSEIDVRRFENLLTQYMQQNNIPTFSLVEGMLYVFQGKIPHDSVHYEMLTTDKLMCWGQYTIDELTEFGISNNRLILAGYPKNVKITKFKSLNNFKKCMVLIARSQFDQANYKLLEILSGYTDKFDICLKLHPSCDYSYYSEYAINHNMDIVDKALALNDCLNQSVFDWAIAVNTTAYYEALMRGVPCLRFEDDSFQLPKGCNDNFSTANQLEDILERLSNTDIIEYQKEVDDILKYTMGIGIDNYREILLGE